MAVLRDYGAQSMAASLRFRRWRQVIHKHLGGWNCYPNQRLNGFPFPTRKAATDSRHVNGCPPFPRFDSQYRQALPERGVADWRNTVFGANSPLGNHVRHPNAGINLDQGECAERQTSPRFQVLRLWLRPSLGDGQDKTCAPRADVITDMGDDLVSSSNRIGGVTGDELDFHSA